MYQEFIAEEDAKGPKFKVKELSLVMRKTLAR